MKLLNVSIGQVQAIQIGSEVLRTGHVKAPIPEPWVITEDGAQGDQRSVHPDKLYAFARTAYAYWGRELGIDPSRWPDGFFGENLTLDTLDEEDVRVGDVFALGDEVRLVVAGARNPCLKLAWRLSQPRTFQKTFALSRHTGMYLGVLATGIVRPGDTLRRLHHDEAMSSIADVCDFVASHHPLPLEPLKRLLDFPGLSQTNRLFLGSKLDAAERAASAVEGRWRGWRDFRIERIVEEAPDIRSFHLSPCDGERLCQPRPGQFVSVRMDDNGASLTRSWSLSAFSHDLQTYRLTVRRQSGAGSTWLHGVQPGAVVKLRAPAGEFVLDMGGFRPVVLVAAGIGITPLLAMLQAHLTRPQAAPVHLIYGARTPCEQAFLAELEALAGARTDVHISHVYSQSDDGARPATRITPQVVIDLLADLYVIGHGQRIALPWYECDMYLCGPGEFCRSIKDGLVARGANADHIFTELFTAPLGAASELESAEIRFSRSGVVAQWRADEDLSLLELAETAGVEVESDCRAGSCLTCRTRILEGASTSDLADGSALLCIGRPVTPMLVLDA